MFTDTYENGQYFLGSYSVSQVRWFANTLRSFALDKNNLDCMIIVLWKTRMMIFSRLLSC